MIKMITCSVCGMVKPHHSKGMCEKCRRVCYYKANLEERRAKARDYYKEHAETDKAASMKWKANHRERVRTLQQGYYKENIGKEAVRKQKYYIENKEACKTRVKLYRIDNPQESRDYVTPASQCLQLNNRFIGSEGHHLSRSVLVYIPKELHRHIWHNLKTGEGMAVINALSLQFAFTL